MITADPVRLLAAAAVLLAYALLCLAIARMHARRRSNLAALEPAPQESPTWVVAYASQTGMAEDLAWQTVNTLHLAGISTRLCSLAELNEEALQRIGRILFVVSTCGEGDPPDNGAAFASSLLTRALPLEALHYAVLALGDRGYAAFCGFGRALDEWLARQGARPLFERIDVDGGDPAAIRDWQQRLTHLAGTSDAPDWSGPDFADWRLVEQRLLNPGSVGAPVFHLELAPRDAASLPDWESGDLVQVLAPADPQRPRDYSIASIPRDGRVHLLVRRHLRPDGTPGLASDWLTRQIAVGDAIRLRVRPHRLFRLGDNADRPLVLIGNGTGLAGLRSHLKARAISSAACPTWLIFGERQAAHDFHYQDEIEAWRTAGVLARLDMVFSRDQPQRRHVQDCLLEVGDTLLDWIDGGAALYVCGSLEGMARGVDEALVALLGRERLDGLSVAGRYRRDVY